MIGPASEMKFESSSLLNISLRILTAFPKRAGPRTPTASICLAMLEILIPRLILMCETEAEGKRQAFREPRPFELSLCPHSLSDPASASIQLPRLGQVSTLSPLLRY